MSFSTKAHVPSRHACSLGAGTRAITGGVAAPAAIAVALPEGEWREAGRFQLQGTGEFAIEGGKAILRAAADFSGHVILLERAV